MAEGSEPVVSGAPVSPRRRRSRIVVAIAIVLLIAGIALFTALEIVVHRAEPILKARVIDTLSTRFDSRVELDQFHVSVLQGLQVSGEGLKLYPNRLNSPKPLFAVTRFSFRTDWNDLLRSPMYIDHVNIDGLDIEIPPKQQRKDIPHLNQPGHKDKIKIFVGEMLIRDARLVLGTNKPGKTPLDFEIHNLKMDSIGSGQPLKFHAILVNPKPIGDIDSSGYFGPFNVESPGDSFVKGDYKFSNADLGSLKGIGGTLSSTGQYHGTLANITVDGETDTPNFSLDVSNHPVPLHTKFHAIVDGTDGDTYLQPVDAMLLHSHIVAQGKVVRLPGQPGRLIQLDVVVGPARIEDMLKLAVRTDPPIMTGPVTLKTTLEIPPGPVSVTKRLRLKGRFDIQNAQFTNPKVQGKIDQLSLRAQGKPEETKTIKTGGQPPIESDMQGDFALANGKLAIDNLHFDVPGADIAMEGVYTLDGNQFDFHGLARLHAHVSEMVTGWKSVLLKAVDPFFAKHGAGTEVPIRVSGTKSEPEFGLDFGHQDAKKLGGKPSAIPPPR